MTKTKPDLAEEARQQREKGVDYRVEREPEDQQPAEPLTRRQIALLQSLEGWAELDVSPQPVLAAVKPPARKRKRK